MPNSWSLTANWESLDTGTPEERAAYAALEIRAGGHVLTEGHDRLVERMRTAPFLSAYPLAEWFAWNWWRLCCEPEPERLPALDWAMSHRMTNVGGGYLWPDITLSSDGADVTIVTRPTPDTPLLSFRYVNDSRQVVPLEDFQRGIDLFVESVLERLDARQVADSNLAALWHTLRAERADAEASYLRKLEAMLGSDPGEYDETILRRMLADAETLGIEATQEIAAGHRGRELPPAAADLLARARATGIPVADALPPLDLPDEARAVIDEWHEPWQQGAALARAVRAGADLGDARVSDDWLTDLFGMRQAVLQAPAGAPPGDMAYLLRGVGGGARLVLRSRNMPGRRFELARLLGDGLAAGGGSEHLWPATRASTRRQKMQRAFAAELLSPVDGIEARLDGDYSVENRQDVADYFGVSEWVVGHQLANNGRLAYDRLV